MGAGLAPRRIPKRIRMLAVLISSFYRIDKSLGNYEAQSSDQNEHDYNDFSLSEFHNILSIRSSVRTEFSLFHVRNKLP